MNKQQREKLINLALFKCYITNKQRDAMLPWFFLGFTILFGLTIIMALTK